ncbi:MAG: class I SAM-dependent rRNA methyltransferase [Sulfurimonas sp.]|nr:class I SAM-dependent rRNA methyltransferase [Sulfurimonas sp.]
MDKEIKISIKPDYVQKYKDGYPLIHKESIDSLEKLENEGSILDLYDSKSQFIAKAYYGIQNKGCGWILSLDKETNINTAFFAQKIKAAIEYRKEFFDDKSTTAFRIFNGEGDGVGGVTIDNYDAYYVITWYSLGIYEFREMIFEALKQSVAYKGIYEKKRFDTKGKYLDDSGDFLFGQKAPEPLVVKENGVNFAVYLDDGAMVGIFLDQKNVRKRLRDTYSKDKTVLNTFSYTGSFSVYAALGGAKKTTSVDVAKRSLSKTREQFEVNKIEEQEIIVEDVFNYFKYALRKKLLFDVVVLDPPSFARSKKRTFSAKKDYVSLLKEAIAITSENGVIIASTNAANFSMMTFRDFIKKAFKELRLEFKVEESYSLPKDFRVSSDFKEGDYLKVVFIRKLSKRA